MLRRLLGAAPDRDAARAEAVRAHAVRLLEEARHELNRADAKAQVLLGVAGIGLGAVAAGLLAGTWSPVALHDAVEWLWWTGVAAALAAVGMLAAAVYPRLGRALRDGSVGYFGDVVRYGSARELARALSRSREPDLPRVAEQLLRISAIVRSKYLCIRWGFWLLLAGVTAALAAVVGDWLLR